jgi:hypothetical protein
MPLLMAILQKSNFLGGWKAKCRYEPDIAVTTAEARFNSWQSDVDELFRTAGVP